MEELDLLKKDWQQNNHEDKQYTENQIYAMLKTQSSSVVKWILIVGIVEFLFWFILNFFTNDESELVKVGLEKYLFYIDFFTYLNYLILLVFIYYFYINFQSISTVSDTKTLMKNILKVRKTVNGYVAYNLSMLGIFSFIVAILSLMNLPELTTVRKAMLDGNHNFKLCLIIAMVLLMVLVFVFIFWIFYKLLYGILLKKLSRNYLELKKIDL